MFKISDSGCDNEQRSCDRGTYESFDKWNIKIFSHTVNDLNEAKQQFTYGVTGIYTDWILPNEMEQMHE